jgi:coenzyme F420-reducing hydrogenase delta subunit
MENFEPVIVAFCCHYCAYTAADMAGSQRLAYPANVKIIRVPCSGKVDALHLVKAFERGADGVYVAGCLEGDCHFKNGIEGGRLEMVNMSAGMGYRFAQVATEITEKIRQMGPSPIHVALAGGVSEARQATNI